MLCAISGVFSVPALLKSKDFVHSEGMQGVNFDLRCFLPGGKEIKGKEENVRNKEKRNKGMVIMGNNREQ